MAVEQNEIKKVITVDLGNTTTSLKEYKKHIDELRGSLLQLDESSEEYQQIAKEIKTEQDKLNEVMRVGKKDTDAAEGSYNQLCQTMAELKKQWKATADEAERASLGKQILDINNQLKELDASTGNYQRNVGDYANAFEQAFGKCVEGIAKIDGPLGELGGTVKNMIPVIKSINSTAIAGLSGVKKAIAATGIGLLVIAVAELITHWQDFTKIIGVSTDSIKDFKTDALNTFESIIAGAVGVGNVVGNFIIAPTKAAIEAFKGLGNVIRDVFTGNWDNIKNDVQNALDAINNVTQKAVDFKGNYQRGVEIGNSIIGGIKERFSTKDAEETVKEAGKAIGKAATKGVKEGVKEETPNTTKAISDLWGTMFKTALGNSIKEVEEEAKRRSNWLKDAIQEAVDEASQEEFELKYSADYDTMTSQERADAEYEIERGLIEKKIELQKTYLDNFIGTQEEKEKELKKISKLQQELDNLDLQHTKETEEKKSKIKKKEQQNLLSASIALFGALSELSEEGSEEAKAFSIMQTILNTLQAIMGIWAGYSDMGAFGVAAAVVQTAAVTALGAATIAKMKSTTKDSASSATVAAPQVQTPTMTEVSPLLDEQADLNRMNMSGMQGDSQSQTQNIKCYVVESDIREAGNRVDVVENNATF